MRWHTSDTGERVLNTEDPLSPRRGTESWMKTTGAREVKDGGSKVAEGVDGKKMRDGEKRKRERERTPRGSRGRPGKESMPLVQQYPGSLTSQEPAI